MRETIKKRSSELQHIYNDLYYFIKVQYFMTNTTSGINCVSSDGVFSLTNSTQFKN